MKSYEPWCFTNLPVYWSQFISQGSGETIFSPSLLFGIAPQSEQNGTGDFAKAIWRELLDVCDRGTNPAEKLARHFNNLCCFSPPPLASYHEPHEPSKNHMQRCGRPVDRNGHEPLVHKLWTNDVCHEIRFMMRFMPIPSWEAETECRTTESICTRLSMKWQPQMVWCLLQEIWWSLQIPPFLQL